MMYNVVIPEWLQWAQAGISGGIMLVLIFGRTYLNKKAENLATKQDIAEITRTTESIKGQLSWAVQNRLSLDEEQRKAVLKFYKKYHYWSSLCEDPTCGSENDDLDSIEQSLLRRMAAFREMDEAYAMYTFFSVDAAMVSQAWDMVKKTIELQRLGDSHLYAMKPIALRIAQQYIAPLTEEKVQEHNRSHLKIVCA
ncbi:MAG: hypothetical protein KIT10_11715 [Flavobacteriales bacterium]|nr:hypothetical protein [Flavobacteriales bacterium]